MAQDETTACNMALGYVGADGISSLTESRHKNAEYCNRYFSSALRSTLEGADWNFARVRRVLAASSDEPPADWAYAYSYPSDCLKFRRFLEDRRTGNPTPFEIALKNDKSGKWILTDLSPATGIFTANITSLALWDAEAFDAFTWKLASLISVPITRKIEVAAAYDRVFQSKLIMAQVGDANEGQKDEEPESSFYKARL